MQTSFRGQQWLEALSVRQGRARELLAKDLEQQQQSGYFYTLPEICRQPQMAFFRCMQEGLHPDSPSRDNVINRVVQRFPLYRV